MADDLLTYRQALEPIDPEGPPVTIRRGNPLLDLMGPPDYVRAPQLRTDGLPDLEGSRLRGRVAAAQSPADRWFDDHDTNMRNFMHQATGLVPGLHAGVNAYNAWADPEHPVTREGRSIPKALGWGALALTETGLGPLVSALRKDALMYPLAWEKPNALGSAVIGSAGLMGLAPKKAPPNNAQSIIDAMRLAREEPNLAAKYSSKGLDPETTTLNFPGLPSPRPRRDAAADMPAPARPLPDLKVHTEPIETYHGTAAQEPFTRFDKAYIRDFGIHSGTPSAADVFVSHGRETMGRVLPMKLGPQDRPFTSLEVKDLGTWQPLPIVRELEKRGVRFSEQELADIIGTRVAGADKGAAYPVIENVLNRHGVDVLRYKNGAEDPGSTSWITWNPETLYSRTSGAQLYGAGAGGLTLAQLLAQPSPTER